MSEPDRAAPVAPPPDAGSPTRFPVDLVHRAAVAYYAQDMNQSEVAATLGVSRSTVSRLLAEGRRSGIVEIRVHAPRPGGSSRLEQDCADSLGIDRVFVVESVNMGSLGVRMAPGVDRALDGVGLGPRDAILVSSGRTLYESVQHVLHRAPGVLVAPTAGGLDEPEPWWQTNEITRVLAERLGGSPVYLHAPAVPGERLYESLSQDPSYLRVQRLWHDATCALLGVGAPLAVRNTRATFFPMDGAAAARAVGDVCSRFYDKGGTVVPHPGSERLVAIAADDLRSVPVRIAVAVGVSKTVSIRAGAAGGFFNQLVTDEQTAESLTT